MKLTVKKYLELLKNRIECYPTDYHSLMKLMNMRKEELGNNDYTEKDFMNWLLTEYCRVNNIPIQCKCEVIKNDQ